LAAALSDGLRVLALVRDSFDVIVFYLPPRFAPYFTDGPFDLHAAVNATAAELGLPTQIISDEALRYRCRAKRRLAARHRLVRQSRRGALETAHTDRPA
jgi:hypothetical protein